MNERYAKRGSDRSSLSSQSDPRFLIIGRIRKPHGVRGELKVAVLSDVPERFTWIDTVYVTRKEKDDDPRPVAIKAVRFQGDDVLIKFAGVESRDAADSFRQMWVKIPMDQALPLEPDEYYAHQAVGWHVSTVEGETLGVVSSLIETGANDVFVVKLTETGKELLLPDIPDIVKTVNPKTGMITVQLMDGLMTA